MTTCVISVSPLLPDFWKLFQPIKFFIRVTRCLKVVAVLEHLGLLINLSVMMVTLKNLYFVVK